MSIWVIIPRVRGYKIFYFVTFIIFGYMSKMKDVYWNYSNDPISVINLSTTGGVILNAVWKQRKEMWYVVDSGIKECNGCTLHHASFMKQ